jgi:hypothetical protein
VLQQLAHNADDFNVLADLRQPGDQAANAPHNQPYRHPGLAGLVQKADDLWVHQGVHLGGNAAGQALPGVFRLD